MAAAKVTFVNQNDKSQAFTVNLYGLDKNRVKVAIVLAVFESSVAIMHDGKVMEDDEDGLSMDAFDAGGTYTLLLLPRGYDGESSSKKLKRSHPSLDLEAAIAEENNYMQDLLAPPSDLPIGVVDLQEFISDGLSKNRRIARYLQDFVKSTAMHYMEWEQAEEESRREAATSRESRREVGVPTAVPAEVPAVGDEKKKWKGFLFVSGDPYENFPGGNLIWVRESYKDLQQIFAKVGAGEKFTLLDIAGIGKSFFTVFWVCYLATLKGKVVWKFSSGTCYLLDFNEKVPIAYGPFFDENEKELSDVYMDTSAWLIIDGRQSCALECKCHILLACSAKKKNYKEFSKNQMVDILYLPIWSKEEIIGLLDDFEDARAVYPSMDVPSREKALEYFETLGGVPRYVLCAKHTKKRLAEVRNDGLSKNRRIARYLQDFVKSAVMHYMEWEQAEEESRREAATSRESRREVGVPAAVPAAGDEKKGRKGFLFVSGDPYENFPGGNLIWIRESYKDLQQIFAKVGAGEKFTLLDTAGIGKSFFTVFWVCYLATLKGKVVWKFSSGTCYLLDFSEKVPIAYGPFSDENEKELSDVYMDTSAWLIIDGRQSCALECKCHILLACSARKKNYKEFSKNQMVDILYLPIWPKEEIIGLLDDFEDARAVYPSMDVPSREKALEYFETLGGVPRYVLYAKHTKKRLAEVRSEIKSLEKDTCLKYFIGNFDDLEMKDGLIHMNCRARPYDTYFFDFASSYVQEEFGNHFNTMSRIGVVEFLEANVDQSVGGNVAGLVFELVAHEVMQRGGKFETKRVWREGKALNGEVEDDPLTLPPEMKVVTFNEVEEIKLEPNTYYKPRILNFESVDVVISPNILVQVFNSRRGQHGYKVNGLKKLHKQLKLSKYKLCSCVPKGNYKDTGFQNFLKKERTMYDKEEDVLDRMDQFVVMVDYNEYKRLT